MQQQKDPFAIDQKLVTLFWITCILTSLVLGWNLGEGDVLFSTPNDPWGCTATQSCSNTLPFTLSDAPAQGDRVICIIESPRNPVASATLMSNETIVLKQSVKMGQKENDWLVRGVCLANAIAQCNANDGTAPYCYPASEL